jgi:formylglycine-generating enzyme required for sulfatase activity
MGDPLVDYYWQHPGYQYYPVVGVSWEAAKFFGKWRSAFLNEWRQVNGGQPPMPSFRLPSEDEWEYAARGGRDAVVVGLVAGVGMLAAAMPAMRAAGTAPIEALRTTD